MGQSIQGWSSVLAQFLYLALRFLTVFDKVHGKVTPSFLLHFCFLRVVLGSILEVGDNHTGFENLVHRGGVSVLLPLVCCRSNKQGHCNP